MAFDLAFLSLTRLEQYYILKGYDGRQSFYSPARPPVVYWAKFREMKKNAWQKPVQILELSVISAHHTDTSRQAENDNC